MSFLADSMIVYPENCNDSKRQKWEVKSIGTVCRCLDIMNGNNLITYVSTHQHHHNVHDISYQISLTDKPWKLTQWLWSITVALKVSSCKIP